MKRIYEVTVTITAHILAESPDQAARWATEHLDDLEEADLPKTSTKTTTLEAVSPECGRATPWVACDVDDEEIDCTVAEWLAAIGGAK